MTDPTPDIPDGLMAYFTERMRQRGVGVARVVDRLSPRELTLAREAAVMAYVHGRMAPDQPLPPTSAILSAVLDACIGMSDLYPTISGLAKEDA